jgi:2-polyprenyl-6-methoxyphenol hydroxylase-like FAD-dependent oxidoreductase
MSAKVELGTAQSGHAIVIGGSIAGLLAARVLAEHFARVTVYDREPPGAGPEPRKSVPQARHSHLLLPPGFAAIGALFPGLFEEMKKDSPQFLDIARDMAWHHFGRWRPRFRADLPTVMCTRPFLEHHIAQRVLALPQVTLHGDRVVEGLLLAQERVVGVRVKSGSAPPADVEADLVVDASGRGSRLPEWLVALGFPSPREDAVRIELGYASCLYQPPADFDLSWKLLVHYPNPPHSWRGGLICNVENGAWSVSLNGYFKDHPPTEEAGFLEFARTLPQPHIYDYLRRGTRLSDIRAYRLPRVRRLRYELLPRFPERLVVVGDAVCYLNPIFAQGMTLATFGAEALRLELAAGGGERKGLGRAVQRRLAKSLALPWFLTTSLDLRFPQAEGTRLPGLRLLHYYIDHLMQTVASNQYVCHQFYRVVAMVADLRVLLQPRALLAVLLDALRGRGSQRSVSASAIPTPLD